MGGEPFEPSLVQQPDAARHDQDGALPLEAGQGPADGLDGEPEVIGNVLPSHRQFERDRPLADARTAFPQAEQEGSHALLRRPSPEQHHVILSQRELVTFVFVQAHQQVQLVPHQGREVLAVEPAGLHRRQRVRRDREVILEREPQEVTWQGETDDLSAGRRATVDRAAEHPR